MNAIGRALKSNGIFSRRRLGLAGLAGVTACAACCAVPLLVASGVGGGALSALAAYVKPGAELVAGLGVAALVLGMAAVRSGQGGAECGCGPTTSEHASVYRSPAPAADEPIVCTADLADKPTLQGQIDGYRAAFAHLVRTERFSGGVRWVFRKHADLETHLKQLAEKEHQCCRFFSFEITAAGEQIVWETRARDAAGSVLEFFSELPERLKEEPRRGADVALLKQRSDAAGLRFAADEEQPR